ncbi:MAG: prepilin-type N-terminal cleavage/methylation domain-containing protein [Phycisphaerae bacterium]|jgi:prepilin-type N-terminal cleavage/methylation domain-containing protein
MKTPTFTQERSVFGRARRGFTLIEVLVVVAIIALLIAILIPTLARARDVARRSVCAGRLHNMGVAVYQYAVNNKGRIIQCHRQSYRAPYVDGVTEGPTVQGNIDPRRAAPGTPGVHPDLLVDWQGAIKRYHLDKETWECPSRPQSFLYAGTPTIAVQGYDANMLRARGYRVDESVDYDQWGTGFQFFGGIRTWQNPLGHFKARSPLDINSKPSWALAADGNMLIKDERWSLSSLISTDNIPPHRDPKGQPAGGNVLTFDTAVNWVPYGRMLAIHGWDAMGANRQGFWWQADLGDYAKELAIQGRKLVTNWAVKVP